MLVYSVIVLVQFCCLQKFHLWLIFVGHSSQSAYGQMLLLQLLMGWINHWNFDMLCFHKHRKQRLTAVGIRYADHVTPLYPQKLALTSQTGGRSVDIVRSRTKATEFFFYFYKQIPMVPRESEVVVMRWLKASLSYIGEISPTRCNNCVFYSQWLYSTCFGW